VRIVSLKEKKEEIKLKRFYELYEVIKRTRDSKDAEKIGQLFMTMSKLDKLATWPRLIRCYIKTNEMKKRYDSFVEFLGEWSKSMRAVEFHVLLDALQSCFEFQIYFGEMSKEVVKFNELVKALFGSLFGESEKCFEYVLKKCCDRMRDAYLK